jgi:hypothetical protein
MLIFPSREQICAEIDEWENLVITSSPPEPQGSGDVQTIVIDKLDIKDFIQALIEISGA